MSKMLLRQALRGPGDGTRADSIGAVILVEPQLVMPQRAMSSGKRICPTGDAGEKTTMIGTLNLITPAKESRRQRSSKRAFQSR